MRPVKFDECVNGQWIERTGTYKRLPARDMIKLTSFTKEYDAANGGDVMLAQMYADTEAANKFFRLFIDCAPEIDFTGVEMNVLGALYSDFFAAYGENSKQ